MPVNITIQNAVHQTDLNGTYTRVKGERCEGRPVYKHLHRDVYLFHADSCWGVGPTVGITKGAIHVRDDADTPDLVTGSWQEALRNRMAAKTDLSVEWTGL